jgi:UDP-N-acetylglucosamine 2-epimerase (non-hydrolysing)
MGSSPLCRETPAVRVMTVFGTRPEAIKLAPVIHALRQVDHVESIVCVTGQHRAMLDQALRFFGIEADHDLDVMRPDQTLTGLAARTLDAMQGVIDRRRPDWIVVQGDTTTAMTAALAAFYNRVRLAHVEAGLRTHDRFSPYPEEVNRRIISVVTDMHFAPTEAARDALVAEGCDPNTVIVTGNTGIDALHWTAREVRADRVQAPPELEPALSGKRLVLVTAHRRESFDTGLLEICHALCRLIERFDDIVVVLPVHPNPRVKGPIESLLAGVERIVLTPPLDYGPFVALLGRAHLILTDSGGIQEEATALGKVMLVMRDTTERPEAIVAGNGILAGVRRDDIVRHAAALLSDEKKLAEKARPSTVFGDGKAAQRVAAALTGTRDV